MIVFLDFDGVLNSDTYFHNRHIVAPDGTCYRDYKESLLPYLDDEWLDRQPEKLKGKVISFYQNICYTNYKAFLKLLSKLDSPKIVLSTSWRHGLCTKSWNVLFNQLPEWNYEIIGSTPPTGDDTIIETLNIQDVLTRDTSRYDEILTYIKKDNITDYIILDDDNIFSDKYTGRDPRFFRTNKYKGLCNSDIRKIMKSIGGK
jgi:hypothetical protein